MTEQWHWESEIHSDSEQVNLTLNDALHVATRYDRVDEVLTLLEGGTDVNLSSPEGRTALQVASKHDCPAAAEVLLMYGASTEIKRKGSTALHIAASRGHHKIVALLLQFNADISAKCDSGKTPLHLAAWRGRVEVVSLLGQNASNLEEPCNDRGFTALHLACEKGYSECVTELLLAGANCDSQSSYGYTPLMTAAKSNHSSVANILLGSYADTDIDATASCGRTALICAAYSGSSDVLKVLITAGADLDIVAQNAFSALSTAIVEDKPDIALLLLEQDVNVNRHYGENGVTALQLAVRCNQRTVVEALIAKGADMEACDTDGDTALQWAVGGNQMDMVLTLLRNGTEINGWNERTGETVLHWAVKCGFVHMTQALLAHGSDPSLLDLGRIRKRRYCPDYEEVDDEDLETCKILVETSLASVETQHAEQLRCPLTHSGLDTKDLAQITADPLSIDPRSSLTNPIYEMEDQVAFDWFISQFQDKVIHDTVKCTGPKCTNRPESLCGIRYKCTWCDTVNFCSLCIDSSLNTHERWHPMIRCLLPTTIHMMIDLEENSRIAYVISDPDGEVRPEDVSHVLYAATDEEAVQQLRVDLNTYLDLDWTEAIALQFKPEPYLFAMCKMSRSEELRPRGSEIIKIDDKSGHTRICKIFNSRNLK